MEARIASATRMVGEMSEIVLRRKDLSKGTKLKVPRWCPHCCIAVRH